MSNPNASSIDFYTKQLQQLVAGTIEAVIRSGAPIDEDDFEFCGLLISFPDGTTRRMWLLSDDEGNGPGSFEIVDDVGQKL